MGRSSGASSLARAVDPGPAPRHGHQRHDTYRGVEEDRSVAQEKQRDRKERFSTSILTLCTCVCMYAVFWKTATMC